MYRYFSDNVEVRKKRVFLQSTATHKYQTSIEEYVLAKTISASHFRNAGLSL